MQARACVITVDPAWFSPMIRNTSGDPWIIGHADDIGSCIVIHGA
jgi:hypothetical protein